jgi:hypothetical protein
MPSVSGWTPRCSSSQGWSRSGPPPTRQSSHHCCIARGRTSCATLAGADGILNKGGRFAAIREVVADDDLPILGMLDQLTGPARSAAPPQRSEMKAAT